LFVKVSVPVSVTLPIPMSIISGFVPSFAEANKILVPLSAAAKVTESPDPVTYLNCTVCDPEVVFFIK